MPLFLAIQIPQAALKISPLNCSHHSNMNLLSDTRFPPPHPPVFLKGTTILLKLQRAAQYFRKQPRQKLILYHTLTVDLSGNITLRLRYKTSRRKTFVSHLSECSQLSCFVAMHVSTSDTQRKMSAGLQFWGSLFLYAAVCTLAWCSKEAFIRQSNAFWNQAVNNFQGTISNAKDNQLYDNETLTCKPSQFC